MSVDEAISIYAEAAQDLASAGLANAAGMHYNCVDLCNQAAEKTLQAVYVSTHDSRAPYDHDLRKLGELVGVPQPMLADLDTLSQFHPAVFLERVDAELADEEVGGEAASAAVEKARALQKWARPQLLGQLDVRE